MILTFMGNGCQDPEVVEVKETSDPVESLVVAVSEVYSTFDVLDDFLSTDETVKKKDDLLIPNSVDIIFTDNSFTDGDGVEFTIDFGELGTEAPFGVLCKDQKYRAGVVHVTISDRYSSPDSKILIHLDENEPFYSGNGADMVKMTGLFEVQKLGPTAQTFRTEDLKVYVKEKPVNFKCNNTVSKVKDSGSGILNDEIKIDGDFSIDSDGEVFYQALITESLKKVYEANCVKNIVSGVITLQGAGSSSHLAADFDPYEDQACDNIVRITINGKSTIHEF